MERKNTACSIISRMAVVSVLHILKYPSQLSRRDTQGAIPHSGVYLGQKLWSSRRTSTSSYQSKA